MRSFTMPLKVLRTIPKGVFTFTRIQDNNCSQHIKNVVLAIKTTSQQISDLHFRLTLLILFLEFFHLPTNIKTNISLMLVYTQFLTDFMAYNVVPFYLDIFSNFLTA